MEQKNINYLILAFVFLIVGAALIGAVATSTNESVDKTIISGETTNLSTSCYSGNEVDETSADCNITVTNYPTSWKTLDCPLTSVTATNNTGTALILDTDYSVFASTGIIQMLNTTDTNSTGLGDNVKIGYTYCPDDYLNSSWGRSILTTVPGFFALALLGVSLWLFYQVFASVGLIGKQ